MVTHLFLLRLPNITQNGGSIKAYGVLLSSTRKLQKSFYFQKRERWLKGFAQREFSNCKPQTKKRLWLQHQLHMSDKRTSGSAPSLYDAPCQSGTLPQ